MVAALSLCPTPTLGPMAPARDTTRRDRIWVTAVVLAVTAVFYAACGGGDEGSPSPSASSAPDSTSTSAPVEDFEAQSDDFGNIHKMTPVRGFFVDNRLGHLDEAVAIAEANEGGTYPVGTIIQLVPQEAMVKRRAGWSPDTNDWEFFFLDVSAEGTTIVDRGTDDVVNAFDLNCASCHQAADPEFDMVCETDHGCEPLPIGRDIIDAVQASDPRPR